MSADELAKLLDELGRRLGPAGEHVFQIALQRVIVQSLVNATMAAVVFVVFGFGIVKITRYIMRITVPKPDAYSYSSSDPFDRLFPVAILWLVGGILLLLSGMMVPVSLTDLFTAEFVTLRTILGTIIK